MPIFAAMSGTHVKTGERSAELTEFPCEVPSEKQLKDWLDLVGPKVKQSHGAILRNEVPANLVGLKAQAEEDLTGYTEIAAAPAGAPAAAPSASDEIRRVDHNRKVKMAKDRKDQGSRTRYCDTGCPLCFG